MFCLCPPGNAIKLNFNNSNINWHLFQSILKSLAPQLHLFWLYFLNLVFLAPLTKKTYFQPECHVSVFWSVAENIQTAAKMLRDTQKRNLSGPAQQFFYKGGCCWIQVCRRGVVVVVVVGMLEIGDWYEGFYKPFHEMVHLAVIRMLRYYRQKADCSVLHYWIKAVWNSFRSTSMRFLVHQFRSIDLSTVFSTFFYIEKLGKIRRLCWKERLYM